jgi:hypothetical protein
MEIFREPFLRGERERLIAAAEAIEPALTDGWKRDREAEARVRTMGGDRPEYCFTCSRSADRQAALVFLTEREPGIFYVANVVPDETGQLSHAEYNAILEEFYERYARPCAEQAGVQAELTPAQVDLEHWLSRPALTRPRHEHEGVRPRDPSDASFARGRRGKRLHHPGGMPGSLPATPGS